MRLERLRVERAPGIDQPFELSGLKPGFNVVLGPNGSGKSLVCRVVQGLLWNSGKANGIAASAQIAVSTGSLSVACDEEAHEWRALDVGAKRPLLPSEHSAGCFMLYAGDLLLTTTGTDVGIANEIKKQMAGGYDLDALSSTSFSVAPQHGKKARRALDGAQRELTRVHEEFRSLAEEEESLTDLNRSIQIAEEASERVRILEVVRQLADEREELARLEAALGALPDGMQRLSGAEGEKLIDRDANLATCQAELEEADLELARKSRQIAELGVVASECSLEEVAAWSERARKLEQIEERCAENDEELCVAEAKELEARSQLVVDQDGALMAAPSVELLNQLDDFLRASEKNRSELTETGARLQALSPVCETATSRDVERGLEALREWIAYPYSAGDGVLRSWLWGLGSVALAAGAWFARQGEERLLVACGIGATLWVWALAVGASLRSGKLLRAQAQASFPARDVMAPEAWESLSVRTRLLELEAEFSDALAEEARASERSFLEQRLAELECVEDDLDDARKKFAGEVGLQPDASSLTLVEVAQRLALLREATLGSREAEERARQAHLQRAEQIESLFGWFGERELAASDAVGAGLVLRELEERVRLAKRLSEEVASLEARRPNRVSDIAKRESRVAEVFADSGLVEGDRVGLEQRLAALAEYRQLDKEHGAVTAQIERLVDALPEAQEQLAVAEVGEALRRVEETASGLNGLLEERAGAKERLRAARCGTRMEEALDEVATARERLVEQREEALDACVGRFLIESIGEEYRQTSSPEVLKRAAELFGQFTHHKYELQLDDSGGQSRFFARDALRNRTLELGELSDGTRMQLLLAARFAYALDVEEECVPFFLDEALSLSDPERLAEIAQVLYALVSEGRQVIYLTSRQVEVEAFRRAAEAAGCEAPHVCDLAAARGIDQRAVEPSELDYELKPAPAMVGSDSPAEYAVRIGVPVPAAESSASALHLFYLLREDLSLLRELVGAGCSTLGQWQASVRAGAARALCTNQVQREVLSQRVRVAEAVFEAWRVGRGKPLTRRELIDSGSVSERYLDGLAELATECSGGVDAFIAVLEARQDERVKGFQKKKLEELTGWLEEHEFLDRRARLEPDMARIRVLADMSHSVQGGQLDAGDVIELTASIWSALELGEAKQQSRKMSIEPPLAPEGA